MACVINITERSWNNRNWEYDEPKKYVHKNQANGIGFDPFVQSAANRLQLVNDWIRY